MNNASNDIIYQIGDATRPIGEGRKAIIHICNDEGHWGAGFSGALSEHWPEPEREYKKWSQDKTAKDFNLGSIQPVWISNAGITVINLIGQHSIRSWHNPHPIRYEAVRAGLQRVEIWQALFTGYIPVHMPRIGCGLAGGKWDRIEPIIKEELCEKGIPVHVYDLSKAGEKHTQACPRCGNPMPGVRGAKNAICSTCGYKESCCY